MNWQPIDGYEGRYEVSESGLVRHVNGSLLGQWKNHNGYLIVRLSCPRAQFRVHRIVAKAFIPNPSALPIVNHLDHDRSHNFVENLEWCTQKQNLDHAANANRMQRDYWRGRRSPNASLTDDQVKEIKRIYATREFSWETLGKKFGVSKRSIGRIISGESYANV